ncbi:interleukin-15 receptor subunit alpha isoform X3 [Desmodus rotundus]|uniref:interleukin-15 receptor subunit alpha isoform X3 n=1 Tax=Desmodus rotundus TaxID=9430 RepID=UPI0023818922|nr:interleukin-15 receptor subunit alpha isoform X3 [Desmodus rotundus]
MARLRLRDCWLDDLPTLLLLLLLVLRPPATLGATCSTPTSIEHANIQVKSYNENSRERYICNFGFKRKAGTSSLTKCLRNEDTNITQWTIPSLKCIKPAFTFKSDTTTATKPTTTQGSRLMTPKPPSAETTGVIGNEPSQDQRQTTAKALGHTLSAPLEKPGGQKKLSTIWSHDLWDGGAYGTDAYSSTAVTVAVSTPVLVICVVCVAFLLVRYRKKSRQNSWTPSVQMENMENLPMTGVTGGREEDAENHHAA